MEQKTKIHAESDKQELVITRDFELPVELLFKAYTEAELVEQWMGTKVIKLDNQKQGAYHFETTDPKGNKHIFQGCIHDFIVGKSIVRTFEMQGTPFPPQLEFLDFEPLGDDRSRLTMKVIYKSTADRDQLLKLPFAQGISMAHDRIQQLLNTLK